MKKGKKALHLKLQYIEKRMSKRKWKASPYSWEGRTKRVKWSYFQNFSTECNLDQSISSISH